MRVVGWGVQGVCMEGWGGGCEKCTSRVLVWSGGGGLHVLSH